MNKRIVYLPNIAEGIFRWIAYIAHAATCTVWTTYTTWSSRFPPDFIIKGRTIYSQANVPASSR